MTQNEIAQNKLTQKRKYCAAFSHCRMGIPRNIQFIKRHKNCKALLISKYKKWLEQNHVTLQKEKSLLSLLSDLALISPGGLKINDIKTINTFKNDIIKNENNGKENIQIRPPWPGHRPKRSFSRLAPLAWPSTEKDII